jgi:hypothetical protein
MEKHSFDFESFEKLKKNVIDLEFNRPWWNPSRKAWCVAETFTDGALYYYSDGWMWGNSGKKFPTALEAFNNRNSCEDIDEIEVMMWEWFADSHPHEAYQCWPERFWRYVRRRFPNVTREQMEKALGIK